MNTLAGVVGLGRSLRWRQRAGLALVALALAVHALGAWQALAAVPAVRAAFWGGMLAALATAVGGLPVLGAARLPRSMHEGLLGFGGGVMLAASAFSLVLPGIVAARGLGAGAWQAAGTVGLAMLAGGALMGGLDRWGPCADAAAAGDGERPARRAAWLFVGAITLHNLPEGLAIGVAYAGTDALRAGALATGIAVQDVPEGFVVALALATAGVRRGTACAVALGSGLVEPVGAVLGAALVSVSAPVLPWGLGLAAGAMVYVVAHDVLPASQNGGRRGLSAGGVLLGFVVMMLLDNALG